MASAYKKFYRQLTKTILTKVVNSQVLGESKVLEDNLVENPQHPVCYVIQDSATSNQVIINNEIEKRKLKSGFDPLVLSELQEEDSFLVLECDQANASAYYPDKMIRLVEYLLSHKNEDILLAPITVLWGRAPENEDRWYKALLADAWTKPTGIKQALNITVYGRENYIEFHKPVSLRALIEKAKEVAPNFSPAHHVVRVLNKTFDQYKEAILGPDLSDRRNVISKLLLSDAVKDAILTESIRKNISLNAAENIAHGYLDEIVSDFSYSTVRFAELLLTKLWTQLYDGIEIHNFEMVRELSKHYELVYTPCHRSHIDYLLLSYVIHKQGLMVPHIAAGINLNMPVVGQLMRGAGAYFIRRSFNGNALYTAVFKEYVYSLVERNTPLEYFIEGGRSRTGLLLPAKKGMLAMTVQSHLRCAKVTKPIVFIPTYFGYEKLLEGSSYIDELGGQKKQAESLMGLLKSLKNIEKVFGKVHVNFGEPVYLKTHLDQHQAPQELGIEDELPDSVKHTVDAVSINILENINRAVVINPVGLIALILLTSPIHTLLDRDVLFRLDELKTYLVQCPYDDSLKLTDMTNQEIIQYVIKLKQVEFDEHDNERWLKVSHGQEHLIKYFMHNIQHVFVLPSLVANVLLKQLSHTKDGVHLDQLKTEILAIYPISKKNFFLKWELNELNDVIEQTLKYFEQRKLLNIHDAVIQVSSRELHLKTLNFYKGLVDFSFDN